MQDGDVTWHILAVCGLSRSIRGFWANITSLNRYSCSKKIFMEKQGTEEKSSERDLSVLIRFWFLYRLNL